MNRRFGMAVFPPTKAFERKPHLPGIHGPRLRRKVSDFSAGLIEKQKLRYMYGLAEKQFRLTFEEAKHHRGITAHAFVKLLEMRLDSVVYNLGFAKTRRQARQFVTHGQIRVNGRKVSIPSYAVKVNDLIQVKDHATSKTIVQKNVEGSTSRVVPDWVRLDRDALSAALLRIPSRDEINPIANEQAVVEFYSR